MEKERQLAILKNIAQSLEDNLEAALLNARICGKVADERGLEAAKKQAAEFEKKLEKAREIEAELTEKKE